MRTHVVFELPDGSQQSLGPGDLIGRLWTCALWIDDGRVSEAHALVSARGDELRLLALRGRFAVDDVAVVDITLAKGQRIRLAEGLELRVVDVLLPETVLGVEGPGVARQALLGVVSVRGLGDRLELLPGFVADADAQLWGNGDSWQLAVRGERARSVEPGEVVPIRAVPLRFVDLPLVRAGAADTRRDLSATTPVRIVARHYECTLERKGEPVVRLDGLSARVVSELVCIGGPAPWQAVAREIWRDETDDTRLRRRWDVTLNRLRARLREVGVRPELVRSDRSGIVTLDTGPDDELVDET